jgi:FKBP-type peptidyl-prolyl cis-trans isomerase
MPQFQAGSKGRIFIPSSYSTGLRNLQVVANLIFEFQLNEVSDYQLTLDSTAIDTFLSVRSISAIKDKSGLRYTIDTLKGGATPRLRDEVRVNYIAKNFSDGVILDQGTSVSFPLLNLILGWQIGLQKMPEGSTFTFYLPSSLAYGAYGNAATIKGNTILIFNVKLLAVTRH